MIERTWSMAMEEICRRGRESTQERARRAYASKAFDPIRDKNIVQTTAKELTDVLSDGKASTIHNLNTLVVVHLRDLR